MYRLRIAITLFSFEAWEPMQARNLAALAAAGCPLATMVRMWLVGARHTTSTRKEGHVLLAWCPPLSLEATDVAGEDGTLLLLGRGWPRASLSSTGRGNLPLPVPDGIVQKSVCIMYDIMLRTCFSASINSILYSIMLRINSELVHLSVMQTC
jgi:hypothetical protein